MSDQIDQEQIQRSFPSTSIPEFSHNRKEETITNLPSFIDSLPNNNDNNNNNSSSLMSSTIDTIMSTNDETTPKTKKAKSRSRKTNSSSGHPIRNKISKDSSTKNEPYTIPYSTRSQTQQLRQQDSSSLAESQSSPSTIVDSNATESTGVNNVMNVSQSQSQVPTTGRKKYCSKCKESSNITKIINSKINRIEELVKDLKKVTDGFSHGVGTNVSQSSKSFTSFGGIDFSKMSIGDLQNFVMIITNAIMTTASTNTSTNNSSLSNVKLEFEESRSGPQLKFETSQ